MAGTQFLTYSNLGKEATRGTAVAPTYQLYAEGTGVLEFLNSQNFHEAENSGVRTPIRRVTRMQEDVNLTLASAAGCSYEDLIIPFSFLNGTATGVGGAADKTWTQTPSMTATNAPKSYSVDVGDDTQNWRCDYFMARSFTIGAAIGDVTSLSMEGFAQQATKVAKASPAINSYPKIPGDLWTIKFASTLAGLPGASISTSFLREWQLVADTGLAWQHHMDGNLFGDSHSEGKINATLSMVVDSTALAVSEFYDKHVADTLSFIRLKATGAVLGGTFYSAQFDIPVLYEEPKPIGDTADGGVNLYNITARLAYDATSGTSIVPVIVNSLAALP